jgi:serine/threonine protein kinase
MQPERLGPYRIVRTLGRGGMGTVYEGVNLETNEPAAIKILSVALAREADFRHRFEGEIEALRLLRHPNIVRLFGFGEQDEVLYYAMELVEGRSLEQELRSGRRFTWRETTQIGIEVCRALRHAHDRGIVHRDLKPANLLAAPNSPVKLSDFGIAQLFGNSRITTAGNVLGTVEFMAPEQADARPVGPRADLYSLGGVLFALLAGRAPFKAKSIAEMLDKQRSAIPEPVSRYAADVPPELESIIAQLLAKDPDARIPNAMLLGRRLEAMMHALSRPSPIANVPDKPEVDGGDDAVTMNGQTLDRLPPTIDAPMSEFVGMPETRLAEPVSGDVAVSECHLSLEHGSLPATKETAAFVPAGSTAEPAAEESGEETKAANRFVHIPEDELDPVEEEAPPRVLISVHTWVLVAALVTMGLTAWYMLRPPSADALYERIAAKTKNHTVAEYLQAESDIREFLERYSNDSRSERLREFVNEIDLNQLERRFYLRSKGLITTEALLPVERDYLEAIHYAEMSPERGIIKLQALIDLYQPRNDMSGPTGQCLELARRRIAQLQEQLNRTSADHLALIMDRLDNADAIAPTEPQRAKAMREAVIELYDGKPWAAEAVKRARTAMGEKDKG